MSSRHSLRGLAALVVAVALVGSVAAPPAAATDYTWQGWTNNLWATSGNWNPVGVPAMPDTAIFDAAGLGQPAVDLTGGFRFVTTLSLRNDAGTYTLSGGTLMPGFIEQTNVSGLQSNVIASTIADMGSGIQIDVAGGTLTLSGQVGSSGSPVTLLPAGVVDTGATLAITNDSTATPNNLAGSITVQGTLQGVNGSLGSTTIILDGGTADLSGRAGLYMSGILAGRVAGAFAEVGEPAAWSATPDLSHMGVNFGDPYTGQPNGPDGLPLWTNNLTWVYRGQFLEDDGDVSFAENFDDNVLLLIDGQQWIRDVAWATPTTSGARTLTPGWHDFEVRFGQGGGGAGAVNDGGQAFLTAGFALGYDTQGRGTVNVGDHVQIPTANLRYLGIGGSADFGNDVVVMGNSTINANGEVNLGALTLHGTSTLNIPDGPASNDAVAFTGTTIDDTTTGGVTLNNDAAVTGGPFMAGNTNATFTKDGVGSATYTTLTAPSAAMTLNVNAGTLTYTGQVQDGFSFPVDVTATVAGDATLGFTNTDSANPNYISGTVTVEEAGRLNIAGKASVSSLDQGTVLLEGGQLDIDVMPNFDPGLTGNYYANHTEAYPPSNDNRYVPPNNDFSVWTPNNTVIDAQVNFPTVDGVEFRAGLTGYINWFGVQWLGYVYIDTAGTITFNTNSDDGTLLDIDGTRVVTNDGPHGMQTVTGTIYLDEGYHELALGFREGDGGAGAILSWNNPATGTLEVVPASALFHGVPGTAMLGNDVTVTADSTLTANGDAVMGELTIDLGTTLAATVTDGMLLAFTDTTVTTAGLGNVGFNVQGSLGLGQLTLGGATNLVKTGSGALVLDETTDAGAATLGTLVLDAGSLVIVGEDLGEDPLGGAKVQINELTSGVVFSSKAGDVAVPTDFDVNEDVMFQARSAETGVATGVNVALQGPVDVATGKTLTLATGDGYTLNIDTAVTGGGNLNVIGGTADVDGSIANLLNIGIGAAGRINANNANALGAGNVVNIGGGGLLDIQAAQNALPGTINVGGWGALGGNIAGVNWGVNVNLAEDAILVLDLASPYQPSYTDLGDCQYWLGVTSLTGNYNGLGCNGVGDSGGDGPVWDGVYKGVIFSDEWTPAGAFTGTLAETVDGTPSGFGVHLRRDQTINFSTARINSANPVTVTGDLDTTLSLQGTWAGSANTINREGVAPVGTNPGDMSNTILNFAVGPFGGVIVPSGKTINLTNGQYWLDISGKQGAVANGGNFNIGENGVLVMGDLRMASSGTYTVQDGGYVRIDSASNFSAGRLAFEDGATMMFVTYDPLWTTQGLPMDASVNVVIGPGSGRYDEGLFLGDGAFISIGTGNSDVLQTHAALAPWAIQPQVMDGSVETVRFSAPAGQQITINSDVDLRNLTGDDSSRADLIIGFTPGTEPFLPVSTNDMTFQKVPASGTIYFDQSDFAAGHVTNYIIGDLTVESGLLNIGHIGYDDSPQNIVVDVNGEVLVKNGGALTLWNSVTQYPGQNVIDGTFGTINMVENGGTLTYNLKNAPSAMYTVKQEVAFVGGTGRAAWTIDGYEQTGLGDTIPPYGYHFVRADHNASGDGVLEGGVRMADGAEVALLRHNIDRRSFLLDMVLEGDSLMVGVAGGAGVGGAQGVSLANVKSNGSPASLTLGDAAGADDFNVSLYGPIDDPNVTLKGARGWLDVEGVLGACTLQTLSATGNVNIYTGEYGNTANYLTEDTIIRLADGSQFSARVAEVAAGTPVVNHIYAHVYFEGPTGILRGNRTNDDALDGFPIVHNVHLAPGMTLDAARVDGSIGAGYILDGDATVNNTAAGGWTFYVHDVSGTGTLTLGGVEQMHLVGTLSTDVFVTNTDGIKMLSSETSWENGITEMQTIPPGLAFNLGGRTIDLQINANYVTDLVSDPGTGTIKVMRGDSAAFASNLQVFPGATQPDPGTLITEWGTGLTMEVANGHTIELTADNADTAPVDRYTNQFNGTVLVHDDGDPLTVDARLRGSRRNDKGVGGDWARVVFNDVQIEDGAYVDYTENWCFVEFGNVQLLGATATIGNTAGWEGGWEIYGGMYVGNVTATTPGATLELVTDNKFRMVGVLTDLNAVVTSNSDGNDGLWMQDNFQLNNSTIDFSGGNPSMQYRLYSDPVGGEIIEQDADLHVYTAQDGSAGWGGGTTLTKSGNGVTQLYVDEVPLGTPAVENITDMQVNVTASSGIAANRGANEDCPGLAYFTNVNLADTVTLNMMAYNGQYLKADITVASGTATANNDSTDTRVLLGDITATGALNLTGGRAFRLIGEVQSGSTVNVIGDATLESSATISGALNVAAGGQLNVGAGTTGDNVTLQTDGMLMINDAGFTPGGLVQQDASIIGLGVDMDMDDANPNGRARRYIGIAGYDGTLTLNNNDTEIGATRTDWASIVQPTAGNALVGSATQINLAGGNTLLSVGDGVLRDLGGATSLAISRNVRLVGAAGHTGTTAIWGGRTVAMATDSLSGGAVTIGDWGELQVMADGFDSGLITVHGTAAVPPDPARLGVLDIHGATLNSDVMFSGGRIESAGDATVAGALTEDDNMSFQSGGTLTFAQGVALGGARTWDVAAGTVAFQGDVTGAALTKTGAGVLRLEGTGGVVSSLAVGEAGVSGGGLAVLGNGAAVPTAVVINAESAYGVETPGHTYGEVNLTSSSGALALGADTGAALTFANDQLTLGASSPATYSGTLVPSNYVYRLGGGGSTLTLAGGVLVDYDDGGGALATDARIGRPDPATDITDAGMVVLGPSNTLTGEINVDMAAGITDGSSIDTAAMVYVNPGGSLDLGTYVVPDPYVGAGHNIVLQGGGVSRNGGTLTANDLAYLYQMSFDTSYVVGGGGGAAANTDIVDGALGDGLKQNLYKIGTSTVTLLAPADPNNPENYYGTGGKTEVQGGVLVLQNVSSIGLSEQVSVVNDGTLKIETTGDLGNVQVDLNETGTLHLDSGVTLTANGLAIGWTPTDLVVIPPVGRANANATVTLAGGGTLDLGATTVGGTDGAVLTIADNSVLIGRHSAAGTMVNNGLRILEGSSVRFRSADAGNNAGIGSMLPNSTLTFADDGGAGFATTVYAHYGLVFDVDPSAGPAGWSDGVTRTYDVTVGAGGNVTLDHSGVDGALATASYTDDTGLLQEPVAHVRKLGAGALTVAREGFNLGSGDARKLDWTVEAGTLQATGPGAQNGLGVTALAWLENDRTPVIASQHLERIEMKSGTTLGWGGVQGFLPASLYGGLPAGQGDGFNPGEFILENATTLNGSNLELGFAVACTEPGTGTPFNEPYLCYPTLVGTGGAFNLTLTGSTNFNSGIATDNVSSLDVTVTGGGNAGFTNLVPGAVGVDVIDNLTVADGRARIYQTHNGTVTTQVDAAGTLEFSPGAGNSITYAGSVQVDGAVQASSGTTDLGTTVMMSAAPAPVITLGVLQAGRAAGAFNEGGEPAAWSPAPDLSQMGLALTDPYTGQPNGPDGQPLWTNDLTWVYRGQFKEDDGVVSFAENFDDNVLLLIDGQQWIRNTGWDVPTTTGTKLLTPGWHDFEVRFGQGGGGAGAVNGGGQDYITAGFALGYDTQGRGNVTVGEQMQIPSANFRSASGGDTGIATVDAGAVLKVAGFQGFNEVNVNGQLITGETTSVTRALNVGAAGQLDLTTGNLVVDYEAWGETPLQQITDMLTNGQNINFGYWDGAGIVSSAAANDPTGLTTLGVMDNAEYGWPDLEGTPVALESVLVKYTYYGDADLDGSTTGDDYFLWLAGFDAAREALAQGTEPTLSGWLYGDFDYSGDITGDDYFLWLVAFDAARAGATPLGGNGGVSAIPEPATLSLLGLGVLAALARRRRSR